MNKLKIVLSTSTRELVDSQAIEKLAQFAKDTIDNGGILELTGWIYSPTAYRKHENYLKGLPNLNLSVDVTSHIADFGDSRMLLVVASIVGISDLNNVTEESVASITTSSLTNNNQVNKGLIFKDNNIQYVNLVPLANVTGILIEKNYITGTSISNINFGNNLYIGMAGNSSGERGANDGCMFQNNNVIKNIIGNNVEIVGPSCTYERRVDYICIPKAKYIAKYLFRLYYPKAIYMEDILQIPSTLFDFNQDGIPGMKIIINKSITSSTDAAKFYQSCSFASSDSNVFSKWYSGSYTATGSLNTNTKNWGLVTDIYVPDDSISYYEAASGFNAFPSGTIKGISTIPELMLYFNSLKDDVIPDTDPLS